MQGLVTVIFRAQRFCLVLCKLILSSSATKAFKQHSGQTMMLRLWCLQRSIELDGDGYIALTNLSELETAELVDVTGQSSCSEHLMQWNESSASIICLAIANLTSKRQHSASTNVPELISGPAGEACNMPSNPGLGVWNFQFSVELRRTQVAPLRLRPVSLISQAESVIRVQMPDQPDTLVFQGEEGDLNIPPNQTSQALQELWQIQPQDLKCKRKPNGDLFVLGTGRQLFYFSGRTNSWMISPQGPESLHESTKGATKPCLIARFFLFCFVILLLTWGRSLLRSCLQDSREEHISV